jgi:hypothetical protein
MAGFEVSGRDRMVVVEMMAWAGEGDGEMWE